MEVSGQLHARSLYSQGKSPLYSLGRKVGRPQSHSGRGVDLNAPEGFKTSVSYLENTFQYEMETTRVPRNIRF
jgi:hypothetical protein